MIAFLVAALLVIQPQDTPRVSVELVPGVARIGETVTLRITVQSRGGDVRIDPPRLPANLITVGTQDYSELSYGTGGRLTITRRDFVMLPQASGEYIIPSIRISLGVPGRRDQRTDPLSLRVIDGTAEEETGAGNANARVSVRMQPETVYVGQQSTLIGEVLLTPDLQVRLTRPPSYDAPAPADFWIQELPGDAATDQRVIDGERYITQRFYRGYFPLVPGRFAFAPARVTYEAREGFLFAPQTRELRSASPRITVLPIPQQGRPPGFLGAVGTLSMTARVEPNRGAVGDAVSLVVEVSGTGNMKALPPPILPALPGFDVLDPSEFTEVSNRAGQLGGTKRFTWVLVPEREGSFKLPAIEYASFDPEIRTFRTHRADPGEVSVVAASRSPRPIVAGLRKEPERNPLAWVHSPFFLLLQGAPFAFLALGLLVRRRHSAPSRRIKPGWDQRLVALRAARANPFTLAEKLLRDVLAEVVPTARVRSGSSTELHADLKRLVSAGFADRVARLLERMEMVRYAPGEAASTDRKEILDELHAVVDAAWKHVCTSARARNAVVPLALALWQAATPAGIFGDGIAAYRDQRFTDAARMFEQYVRTAPADASGWYNLAITYEAERRPAHAAWALLRTLELQPRADEVEAHLQRLGVARLARDVRPFLRLTSEETWLFASALWWLGAALLALAIVRRRRKLGSGALIPIFLAGLLLLFWAVERGLPPPAVVLDQGAPMLAGQSLHADVVRHLQPLTGVEIMEEHEGWLRVRTRQGETGWVSSDGLGRF